MGVFERCPSPHAALARLANDSPGFRLEIVRDIIDAVGPFAAAQPVIAQADPVQQAQPAKFTDDGAPAAHDRPGVIGADRCALPIEHEIVRRLLGERERGFKTPQVADAHDVVEREGAVFGELPDIARDARIDIGGVLRAQRIIVFSGHRQVLALMPFEAVDRNNRPVVGIPEAESGSAVHQRDQNAQILGPARVKLLEHPDRCFVVAHICPHLRPVQPRCGHQRVEFAGLLGKRQCLAEAAHTPAEIAHVGQCGRIARRHVERLAQQPFARGIGAPRFQHGERAIGPAPTRIEPQRRLGLGQYEFAPFEIGLVRPARAQCVRARYRKQFPAGRIGRRGARHHFEQWHRFARRVVKLRVPFGKRASRAQENLVDFGIERHRRRRPRERDSERARDLLGDPILQIEYVAEITIEPFGPHDAVALALDQFGGDAHFRPAAPDGAIEQMRRSQRRANGRDRLVGSAKLEAR